MHERTKTTYVQVDVAAVLIKVAAILDCNSGSSRFLHLSDPIIQLYRAFLMTEKVMDLEILTSKVLWNEPVAPATFSSKDCSGLTLSSCKQGRLDLFKVDLQDFRLTINNMFSVTRMGYGRHKIKMET